MLLDSLFEQHKAGRIDLYAACVMPDHVHMLMAPVEKDVVEFANSWKSWTTRLSWRLGNRNALWQPGMWDRTIRDERDFNEVVEYIVANPMKSGLVESEQEWPHAWNWCQDEPPE
jgi:REP element-mobilizing transposase RayT